MSSENIYDILSTKSHNPHYLNRYCKFINVCVKINSLKTKEELGYTEKHHICPKAKDMFPEYKSLSKFPWNKAILTARQHFIAHWILMKTYGESQATAFWRMRKGNKKDSKTYQISRNLHSQSVSKLMKGKSRYKDKFGNKFWLDINDPKIEKENLENILKGIPSSSMRGKSKYYTEEGILISCKTNDPRVLDGTFTNFAKGRSASDFQKKRASETFSGRKLTENQKNAISLKQRDDKIYSFKNLKTQENFIGQRIDFKNKFGFVLDHLFGKFARKYCKDWILNHCFEEKSTEDVSNILDPGDFL